MKKLTILAVLVSQLSFAQDTCENIIIISTDGFRWQEVFKGADPSLVFNPRYVKDSSIMRYLYWADSPEERRKKLMPFTWNLLAHKGQLWGNRDLHNEVSVANPYRYSYAGYNELLTGFADHSVITNRPKKNLNDNLLGFFNTLPAFKDKVALFGSWNLFSYIVNGGNKKIPLNCGYEAARDSALTLTEQTVNYLQEETADKHLPTRSDLLTFSLATEYIKKKHPRIVYIGFGETDEFAHRGEYDKYLDQANLFDKFLAEIWSLVQSDAFYKNKTTLFITTDHGRGKKANRWTTHGPITSGSEEIWMMQIGPNILPKGEMKTREAITSEQFAQTISRYLGETFISKHPVGEPVYSMIRE